MEEREDEEAQQIEQKGSGREKRKGKKEGDSMKKGGR